MRKKRAAAWAKQESLMQELKASSAALKRRKS